MITVTVLINGHPIATRTAVNIGRHKVSKKLNKYQVDDGNVILHHTDDGAIELAKQLLDLIKEVK